MVRAMVGSYRVLREIGKGGMGRVYLAEHALIGKRVAVKVLLPEYSANADVINRFFNEARSLTVLNHSGIVEVYDFGYLPNGSAYMLMEYLQGESLKSLLGRVGRLSDELIVDLGRQVAVAVGAAHAKQIIHRDLKPDNIFLVPDEEMPHGLRAKVVDFGIAKLALEPGLTLTGAVIGTPTYMSPEQFQSAATIDHRADIYSLGCVLYRMAAGRPPFMSNDPTALIAAHLFEAPPPLTHVAAGVQALIATALAKSRDGRFQSMGELARAFEHAEPAANAAADLPESLATAPIAASTTVPGFVNASRPRTGSVAAPRRRRGMTFAAATVAAAALGALVVARAASHKPVLAHSVPTRVAVSTVAPPAASPPAMPAAPRQIHLRLSSEPPGAVVYRSSDGVRLGKTPWSAEYPASDEQLVLVVRRAGYREAQAIFSANQDATQSLILTRTAMRTGVSTGAEASVRNSDGSENNHLVDPFEQK